MDDRRAFWCKVYFSMGKSISLTVLLYGLGRWSSFHNIEVFDACIPSVLVGKLKENSSSTYFEVRVVAFTFS